MAGGQPQGALAWPRRWGHQGRGKGGHGATGNIPQGEALNYTSFVVTLKFNPKETKKINKQDLEKLIQDILVHDFVLVVITYSTCQTLKGVLP